MLRNEHIRLRALEPDDLELLYRVENDTSLWHVGTTNEPLSRQSLRDYLLRTTSDIYADRQLRLVIETVGREPVGMIDLANFEPRHWRAEVGIVVLAPYGRKGYASQALSLLIDYCRHFLHLHQLYASVPAANQPSLRLFKQAGFHQTAILKDWLATPEGYEDVALFQLLL